VTDIMQEMHQAMEDMFNKAAGVTGWTFRDFPRMSVENFEKLTKIIGSENMRNMVGSEGNHHLVDGKRQPCETWVRFSVIISPEGMERLKEYNREPD